MATINRKTRIQLNLNSSRIRFGVEKLTPVSEIMVKLWHIKYTRIKKAVCLMTDKSQIYFKPRFLHDNE